MKRFVASVLCVIMIMMMIPLQSNAEANMITVKISGKLDYDLAYGVLDALNEYRVSSGIHKLTMDTELLEIAMKRSTELGVDFDPNHIRPDGTDCGTIFTGKFAKLTKGENIAVTTLDQSTVSSVMSAWKKSPGHNKNMLAQGYNCIGIGVFSANGYVYWVLSFSSYNSTSTQRISGKKQVTASVKVSMTKMGLNVDVTQDAPGEPLQFTFYVVSNFKDTNNVNMYSIRTYVTPDAVITKDPQIATAEIRSGVVYVNPKSDKATRVDFDFDGSILMVEIPSYQMSFTYNDHSKTGFVDVPDDSWYTDGVVFCCEKGYMAGTSGNSFSPNSPVTRAMFVTILSKIDSANTSSYTTSSFADVEPGKWYSKTVEWAYKNGYAAGLGYDSKTGKPIFGHDGSVTREQLAQFFYTYSQKKGYSTAVSADLSGYSDYWQLSSWAAKATKWAVGSGLISGTSSTTLSPKAYATRAQIAMIVKNYVNVFQKGK